MNRRHLLAGLVALPALHVLLGRASAAPGTPPEGDDANSSGRPAETLKLTPSGRVTSRGDEQVIENLDVDARSGNAVTVLHRRVTIRNCRIRHAGGHGVHAKDAAGLVLQDLEIDHVGAPPTGAGPSQDRNNVNIGN